MKRLWILAALLPTVACSPTLQVVRMKPAEADMTGRTRIAFVPFKGNDGENLSNEVQRAVTGTPGFQLVDREMLGQILREQKMTMTGLVKDDGSLTVGGLISAGAFVAGDAVAAYDEEVMTTNTRCTRYENGKSIEYPCRQNVRRGRVDYGANIKVVDSNSGLVIATQTFQQSLEDSHVAHDSTPPGIDREGLIRRCRNQVAEQMRHVILPHSVTEQISLVRDGDIPEIAEGNEFAKAGNMSGAASKYSAAVARVSINSRPLKDDQKAKAFYALGVALVLQGEFPRGIECLQTAAALSPDKMYFGMLTRAQAWQEEQRKVSQQTAGTREGTN